MIVKGFICDCCEKIFKEDEVFALKISPGVDLFTNKYEYNMIESSSSKYNTHFCLSCYTEKVTDLVSTHKIDRLVNKTDYVFYLSTYRYNFFKRLHHTTLCRK